MRFVVKRLVLRPLKAGPAVMALRNKRGRASGPSLSCDFFSVGPVGGERVVPVDEDAAIGVPVA
eukprot:6222816-Lingulodinium_polyedra.AAC.1